MADDGMTQGARANANGQIFEMQLVPLFEGNGYVCIKYSEYKKDLQLVEKLENNPSARTRTKPKHYAEMDKLVIMQYPFTSIYGQEGKTEFLIVNRLKSRVIRVECKWQQAAGSVDEKFPYMYLNCLYGYEEVEVVLIVDGGGYKPGARAWLERVVEDKWLVDEENPKKISIMTISEFTAWFNKEMR